MNPEELNQVATAASGNLFSTLLEAGKGNIDASAIQAMLHPPTSLTAGPTAPPQGLFLVSVEYPR